MSEQAMYDIDNTFGVKLLNPVGNAVLPIDIHDFADAADHCVLVDKTMFIADILDCESTVALCCRPHGFGKSMNLSMLKCYLELPVPGSSNVNLFIGSKIWDAEDGVYRDEYARYPVIALDFSASSYRGADAEAAMRDAVARECARLLPLLDVPDLARGDVRHIERVARGVAGSDEIDSALGVLIELLRMACDEQVVLLVDGYDAAFSNHMQVQAAYGSCFIELLDRLLFEGIVSSIDSLRLVCLMGERPSPARAALAHRNCPYCLASPLSSWCDRWFGFSDAENRALLDCAGQSDRLACAREWFEGYRFGGFYCSNPARVVEFLARGCLPPTRFDVCCYADCLNETVGAWDLRWLAAMFDLLNPYGCVEAPLCLDAVKPDAGTAEGVWTDLYLSGLLTTDATDRQADGSLPRALRLPNNELRYALRLVIIEWFECAAESAETIDDFQEGLCRGGERAVRRALDAIINDLGVDGDESDLLLAFRLALQGLCFGLPGYADPVTKRAHGSEFGGFQVFPTVNTFDAADTLGILDSRPLISVSMLYDPDVDALGLELLSVQALLDIERSGLDDIRVPRPAVGRVRWGFGFDGKHVSVVCQRL